MAAGLSITVPIRRGRFTRDLALAPFGTRTPQQEGSPKMSGKKSIVDKIAPSQAARLSHQPIGPAQIGGVNPAWIIVEPVSKLVQITSARESGTRPAGRRQTDKEMLLCTGPHSADDDRRRQGDQFTDLRVVIAVAVERGSDGKTRVRLGELISGTLDHAGSAADECNGLGALADPVEHKWCERCGVKAYACRTMSMEQTQCPAHADPVRQYGVELVKQPAISRISRCHRQGSRVYECEQGGLCRLIEHVEQMRCGLVASDRIDAKSQGIRTHNPHVGPYRHSGNGPRCAREVTLAMPTVFRYRHRGAHTMAIEHA
ncbi:MAG: hypothetical protein WB902_28270 [Acetobacteraceae bacterium]